MTDESPEEIDLLFNCYSIMCYLIAIMFWLFPPQGTLVILPQWALPLGIAVMGPIGTWAMVSDLKDNKAGQRTLVEE